MTKTPEALSAGDAPPRRRSRKAAVAARAELAARLGLEDEAGAALLAEALTHQSVASGDVSSNQRLEFLGDRVLGLVMADELSRRHPREPESMLALRFNHLVRRESCAAAAQSLNLGEHLHMAHGEALTGGKRKLTLLADAVEAVLAAVYLARGLNAARALILEVWAPLLEAQDTPPQDAKTALQEWAQSRGFPPPLYRLSGKDGPDHAPRFLVTARLLDGREACGAGASKQAAERAAAAALLNELEREAADERP